MLNHGEHAPASKNFDDVHRETLDLVLADAGLEAFTAAERRGELDALLTAKDGLVCKVTGYAGNGWKGAATCECWSCETRREINAAIAKAEGK
jgi:hypothetical protein